MSGFNNSNSGGETSPKAKRPKVSAGPGNSEEAHCVLCFKTAEELAADDLLFLDAHSCGQCNKDSWRICETCEETCLSRKCPVCRGEYAPVVMYEFPELRPNASSPYPQIEAILFQAKLSLLLKVVTGSNTAVYLPGLGVLRFLLPQDTSGPDSEQINRAESEGVPQFMQVEIPISHDRVADGRFIFADRVWDELEAIQEQADNNEVEPTDFIYIPVDRSTDAIPERILAFIGKTFVDREEGLIYRVVNIVKTESMPGVLFFEYRRHQENDEVITTGVVTAETTVAHVALSTTPGTTDEADRDVESEYSTCEEMLCTNSWALWSHNPRLDDEDWVQCGGCNKWRRLPQRGSEGYPEELPSTWICSMNTWDLSKASCEADEDAYEDTVPVVIDGVPVPEAPGQIGRDHGDFVDLQVAVRRILETLQTHPGARLFTRLTPETTSDVLRIAAETKFASAQTARS